MHGTSFGKRSKGRSSYDTSEKRECSFGSSDVLRKRADYEDLPEHVDRVLRELRKASRNHQRLVEQRHAYVSADFLPDRKIDDERDPRSPDDIHDWEPARRRFTIDCNWSLRDQDPSMIDSQNGPRSLRNQLDSSRGRRRFEMRIGSDYLRAADNSLDKRIHDALMMREVGRVDSIKMQWLTRRKAMVEGCLDRVLAESAGENIRKSMILTLPRLDCDESHVCLSGDARYDRKRIYGRKSVTWDLPFRSSSNNYTSSVV